MSGYYVNEMADEWIILVFKVHKYYKQAFHL